MPVPRQPTPRGGELQAQLRPRCSALHESQSMGRRQIGRPQAQTREHRAASRHAARRTSSVKRAIGECLGEMDAADFVGAVEVGERAGHPQHAMIAARRKPHGVGGFAQQRKSA